MIIMKIREKLLEDVKDQFNEYLYEISLFCDKCNAKVFTVFRAYYLLEYDGDATVLCGECKGQK